MIYIILNSIYQFITLIFSFILFPFFFINKRGRKNIFQRYGFWDLNSVRVPQDFIWLHAASFGEVNALIPFIKILKGKYPQYKILLTTVSDSGLKKARQAADYAFLCPFDNMLWLHKALSGLKIRFLIVSETEIWPAMLAYAKSKKIPAFLINARISDYTLPFYSLFSFFLKQFLNQFIKVLAVNHESADKFKMLKVTESRIKVCGYTKYDIKPELTTQEQIQSLYDKFFENKAPVLALGSIRPEEEEIWFPAIRQAQNEGFDFNIIIAPRHNEKTEFFKAKLMQHEIDFDSYSVLKSESKPSSKKAILLDTMGDLSAVYSFSDLSFVGATLVNIGGHNPLEPVQYKSAVCCGPHYNNIRDIIDILRDIDAVFIIKTREQAYQLIRKLAGDLSEIKHKAEKAFKFWLSISGASEKILEQIGIQP